MYPDDFSNLKEYILGKKPNIVDEKIFNDLIRAISNIDEIKSLSNIVVDILINVQKDYFKNVLYEFNKYDESLKSYTSTILQVNDDFWKNRVNKVIDKVKEYNNRNFQELKLGEKFIYLEFEIQKLRRSVVVTSDEDIVFINIIKCIEETDYPELWIDVPVEDYKDKDEIDKMYYLTKIVNIIMYDVKSIVEDITKKCDLKSNDTVNDMFKKIEKYLFNYEMKVNSLKN